MLKCKIWHSSNHYINYIDSSRWVSMSQWRTWCKAWQKSCKEPTARWVTRITSKQSRSSWLKKRKWTSWMRWPRTWWRVQTNKSKTKMSINSSMTSPRRKSQKNKRNSNKISISKITKTSSETSEPLLLILDKKWKSDCFYQCHRLIINFFDCFFLN